MGAASTLIRVAGFVILIFALFEIMKPSPRTEIEIDAVEKTFTDRVP